MLEADLGIEPASIGNINALNLHSASSGAAGFHFGAAVFLRAPNKKNPALSGVFVTT